MPKWGGHSCPRALPPPPRRFRRSGQPSFWSVGRDRRKATEVAGLGMARKKRAFFQAVRGILCRQMHSTQGAGGGEGVGQVSGLTPGG